MVCWQICTIKVDVELCHLPTPPLYDRSVVDCEAPSPPPPHTHPSRLLKTGRWLRVDGGLTVYYPRYSAKHKQYETIQHQLIGILSHPPKAKLLKSTYFTGKAYNPVIVHDHGIITLCPVECGEIQVSVGK